MMDSFYDMPRRAPAPTPIDKFLAAPAVPEVSLFCPANGQMNYNAWRLQQNQPGHYAASSQISISNMRSVESSITLKKQVRFEGPISQHCSVVSSRLSSIRNDKTGKENKEPSDTIEHKPLPPVNSFEQMYMANIPNRQLDLSLVDLPKNNLKMVQSCSLDDKDEILGKLPIEDKNIENTGSCDKECESNNNYSSKNDRLPKTYQEFLEKQKKVLENKKNLDGNCVTDLYNYKRSPMKIPSAVFEKKYNDNCSDSSSERIAGILENIGPYDTNNQQALNRSIPRRNVLNSKEYNLNDRLNTVKHPPSTSHCKCAHAGHNMCSINQHKNARCDVNGANTVNNHLKQISPASTSNEPTNTDLLKIIAQQNEQLLLLQKQVAVLLSREQPNAKPIMAPQNRQQVIGEKIISSTQTEHFHQQMYTPKKRGLSKFSIDMMTSFEVAIRPSLHNKNQFSKIQEITETESAPEPMEPSLRLESPIVNVPEECPSPEPTMNIEMQDYDSSDDDRASEIGVTFYKNLMGQVNNILKKAQHKAKESFIDGKRLNEKNDKTMQRIKEATLKHLKNIGVTIDNEDTPNNSSFSFDDSNYSPSEVSFAVKQLLMKYLPDEELAKIAQMKKPNHEPFQEKQRIGGGCNVPPQFSMASIEYLKKYNIIQNSDNDNGDVQTAPNSNENRILNITALKKQPKLL